MDTATWTQDTSTLQTPKTLRNEDTPRSPRCLSRPLTKYTLCLHPPQQKSKLHNHNPSVLVGKQIREGKRNAVPLASSRCTTWRCVGIQTLDTRTSCATKTKIASHPQKARNGTSASLTRQPGATNPHDFKKGCTTYEEPLGLRRDTK